MELVKSVLSLSLAVAAWGFACTGCPKAMPPEPPYVVFPPYQDASTADANDCNPSADCRLACESLAKVGCPESAPAGLTCECTCTKAQADNIDMHTLCLANASTVEQVRACGPRCLGR